MVLTKPSTILNSNCLFAKIKAKVLFIRHFCIFYRFVGSDITERITIYSNSTTRHLSIPLNKTQELITSSGLIFTLFTLLLQPNLGKNLIAEQNQRKADCTRQCTCGSNFTGMKM